MDTTVKKLNRWILFVFTSLLLNPAFAEKLRFTPMESLTRLADSDFVQVIKNDVEGSGLGFVEVVNCFEVENRQERNWELVIEKILRAIYFDEMEILLVEKSPDNVEYVVENLNFTGTDAREYQLLEIKAILEEALDMNEFHLYSLESFGHGTFAEGNGFAVVDDEYEEVLIVMTGYAE